MLQGEIGAAKLKKPVLIILHQEQSTPGNVGRLLQLQGHPLDIRRPRFGDPLPGTLMAHAGAVIFGGPMSANDNDNYIKDELQLIEVALEESVPYLGICLGAQLMARCLGARVAPDKGGHVEIGYHPLVPLPESVRWGGIWPTSAYQWHSEGFDLPAGSIALAGSPGPFPNQAFSVGPAAVGLQFHPEITYGMIARWSGRNEVKLDRPGAQPRPHQLDGHVALGPGILAWGDRLLADWISSGTASEKRRIDSVVCKFATVHG